MTNFDKTPDIQLSSRVEVSDLCFDQSWFNTRMLYDPTTAVESSLFSGLEFRNLVKNIVEIKLWSKHS